MRLHFYSFSLVLLFGLTAMVSAQELSAEQIEALRVQQQESMRQAQRRQREMMRSPVFQQAQRNAAKQVMNSFWNGDGADLMAMGLLHDDETREGIGVSREQQQKIQDATHSMYQDMVNDPRIKPLQEEMNKLMLETPGGPFGGDASEETQKRFVELQMEIQLKMQETMLERMTNVVTENLTSDQLKKVKEFQISMMGEFPIVSPNMFEALDLSDAQKQQLIGIKKELQPEFERNMDRMIDVQMKFTDARQDELEKLQDITNPEERQKLLGNLAENVRKSNPELQREMNEMMESGKGFANQLKFKMFDVLTDEQMERMAQLINNPPDYAKKMVAKIRKLMGNDDSPTNASGEWKPNANSWKPGDPIPAEYLEQRQERRFPKKTQ